jgi:CheY-like chemotaxis protein
VKATRAIRGKEELTSAHVPIVAMTAHAMDTHREESVKAGMDAYITKPILPKAPDEILSRFRNCARQGSP